MSKDKGRKEVKNLSRRSRRNMPLSPIRYRQEFLGSALATKIKEQLALMESDTAYITEASYSPSSITEAGVSFTDKHLTYLSMHPKVDPGAYMSNLRLKTKVSNHRR